LLVRTQQIITTAVYAAWESLAKLVGRQHLTHSEGIQFLRTYLAQGKWSLDGIYDTDAARAAIPADIREAIPASPNFDSELERIDTEAKFESWLLLQEEPSKEGLQSILETIAEVLPRLRDFMIARAKQLPHRLGGRPEELSPEQKRELREEIKRRREPGTKLEDIFRELATIYKVSDTTIKRAWYEERQAQESEDDKIKE
jgi:hypothetical protein